MNLAAVSSERDQAGSGPIALARSLLIVDADRILRERLAAVMRECGFDVHQAESYAQARALAHAQPPDMLLLDPRLPDCSGLALIDELRPTTAIVIWSAYSRIGSVSDAHRFSGLPHLRKPVDADDILAAFGCDPRLPA